MKFYHCRSLLGLVFYADDLLKWLPCNLVRKPNVKVIKNVVYDEALPDVCTLDIYFDESKRGQFSEGKFPVFFNIHGGGWISGDKSFRVGLCKHIADIGCAVVNINYGLAPKYKFPDMMRHLFAAFTWLEREKDTYGFDLDKIIISGDSAGGHLSAAAINALRIPTHREKLALPEFNHKIKGFVSYCSAFDTEYFVLRIPFARDMIMYPTGKILLHNLKKRYEYYDQYLPLQHVTEDFPATMVVMGVQDIFTLPCNLKFCKILEKNGVPFEKYLSWEPLNAFHDFNLRTYMPSARLCMKRVKAFICRTLTSPDAYAEKENPSPEENR